MTRATPIWIYDKNERLQLILNPEGDIPHYDSWFTEQLNGAITLEFTVPASDPRVSMIENDGRAVIRDRDGELIEFIIRRPNDIDGEEGPQKAVYAEGGDYELIDEWMPGYTEDNVHLETALEAILSGTRWRIGQIENLGTQSVDIKPTTVKNAIMQLLEIYGGEVRYRITASGNQITNRYIDIYRERGIYNGRRFEMGKDIQSISYLADSTGIKTALYGYGASGENDAPRVTFADVEWRTDQGDPVDKPKGQRWVGDPHALERWGYAGGTRHRFGEYSGQEEDPAQLLLNTWNELQAITKINETYETEVALLEVVPGYDRTPVRLGDMVAVIDRNIHPNIEAMASIVEYRQNLNDSQLDEVVIGEFRNVFDSARRVRENERIIEDKQGNWDKKETPEGAEDKAEGWARGEAQKAIDEAQERIDEATQEIEQAMGRIDEAVEEISRTKIDITEAQRIIDEAYNELDRTKIDITEAEKRIEDAFGELDRTKIEISDAEKLVDDAVTEINRTKIEISDAEKLISDTIANPQDYEGEFTGDLIADSLIVRGPIVSQNATITGTISASNATFVSATMEKGTIIDATMRDATITGRIGANFATFINATMEKGTIIEATMRNATITGRIGASNATFVSATMEKGTIIDAVMQDATITGRIRANNATFLSATMEEGIIIDATIRDANITGTLNGVDGRFIGQLDGVDGTFVGRLVGARILSNSTINVETDLYVGRNMYLGDGMGGDKNIIFNNNVQMRASDFGVTVSGDDFTLAPVYGGTVSSVGFSRNVGGQPGKAGSPGIRFEQTYTNSSQIYQDNNDFSSNYRLKLETQNGNGGAVYIGTNGYIYFLYRGSVTHGFYADGTKDGGSIDIDGNRYGMSPIDSPQTLLFDIIRDIDVQGKTKIYLTDLFAKAIEEFSVFPNNPKVTIEEKGEDYFIVKGHGLTDFQIIGNRVGFADSYFTDLSAMSEEMRGSDGELPDEEAEDNQDI